MGNFLFAVCFQKYVSFTSEFLSVSVLHSWLCCWPVVTYAAVINHETVVKPTEVFAIIASNMKIAGNNTSITLNFTYVTISYEA